LEDRIFTAEFWLDTLGGELGLDKEWEVVCLKEVEGIAVLGADGIEEEDLKGEFEIFDGLCTDVGLEGGVERSIRSWNLDTEGVGEHSEIGTEGFLETKF